MSVTTGAVGGKERAGANTLLVVLLIAAILVAVFAVKLPARRANGH